MRVIGLAVVLTVGLALAQLAPALSVETQPASSVRRIGFLSGNSSESTKGFVEEFRRGLRERGYVEGQNIHVEYRWADGKADRLPGLVTELIGFRVELLVVAGSPSARAAHQATRTLPIVMVAVGNPVELGLAASLAHPGGNVTGFTSFGLDLTAKQLELLREAVPDMTRLAVLWTPANPLHPGREIFF
jgi:putative tryptophan/tyrosine transport system substrate-binding protein